MVEKKLTTPNGAIHYWSSETMLPERKTLVFLPGLTADHRLFDKQFPFFAGRYNLLTWDAPGHALSRPFTLDFSLMDKAGWLHEILERETVCQPVLIGQSMGGYVSQCYMEQAQVCHGDRDLALKTNRADVPGLSVEQSEKGRRKGMLRDGIRPDTDGAVH